LAALSTSLKMRKIQRYIFDIPPELRLVSASSSYPTKTQLPINLILLIISHVSFLSIRGERGRAPDQRFAPFPSSSSPSHCASRLPSAALY
jgi:hypothetical protein